MTGNFIRDNPFVTAGSTNFQQTGSFMIDRHFQKNFVFVKDDKTVCHYLVALVEIFQFETIASVLFLLKLSSVEKNVRPIHEIIYAFISDLPGIFGEKKVFYSRSVYIARPTEGTYLFRHQNNSVLMGDGFFLGHPLGLCSIRSISNYIVLARGLELYVSLIQQVPVSADG